MKIGEKWVDFLELPDGAENFFEMIPDRVKVCLMYKPEGFAKLRGNVSQWNGYYIAETFGVVETENETVFLLGPYYWEMAGKWERVPAKELFNEILGK